MRQISISLLFLISVSVYGQQMSSEVWHDGFLVTVEGDTLTGSINYDIEANMVQFTDKHSIKAFSSYKVFYFEIFDSIYRSYRQFYTVPYRLRGNFETPVLFELLYEGGLSLLAREKIVQETVSTSNPFWSGGPRVVQNRLKYDFYFLDKKGKIIYYDGNRSDLFQIMSDKRDQLKEYIRSNRLQTNEVKDLIRITSFYNSI